jgi:hypothetical protein
MFIKTWSLVKTTWSVLLDKWAIWCGENVRAWNSVLFNESVLCSCTNLKNASHYLIFDYPFASHDWDNEQNGACNQHHETQIIQLSHSFQPDCHLAQPNQRLNWIELSKAKSEIE